MSQTWLRKKTCDQKKPNWSLDASDSCKSSRQVLLNSFLLILMDFGRRTNYKCDGTGRDRYISINNGGLGPSFKPAPAPEVRRFSAIRVIVEPRPAHEAKFTTYVSNGKGRDSYIL